jgi:hypothetical protein
MNGVNLNHSNQKKMYLENKNQKSNSSKENKNAKVKEK